MALPPGIQVPVPGNLPLQMTSPTKEVNAATLCKIGQELVQDIVQKTTDIFNYLKSIHLPNGTTLTVQMTQERKLKLEELIHMVSNNFRKLKMIHDMIRECTAPLEDTPVQDLLPVEENGEVKMPPTQVNDAVKFHTEEHKEIVEQIQLKNQQLKNIIDNLREVIWEINTMMAMRHS